MIRTVLSAPLYVLGLAFWLGGGGLGAALWKFAERVAGERRP